MNARSMRPAPSRSLAAVSGPRLLATVDVAAGAGVIGFGALLGYRSVHPIDPTGAEFFSVVDDEKEQVAVQRAAQRIRLDAPWTEIAFTS